tara:strand:+ start:949 stop:1791 length:843 start_codon:yes stop_codon:yes gene_type:complete
MEHATTQDLHIYPIKIEDDALNTVDKYPLLPIPFFLTILGRVKAGKSTLLNSLTLSPRFYGDDFQIKILISPTARSDPAMKHIIEHFQFVFEEYSEELLDEIIEMVENDEHGDRYLLVLDDAITTNFKQSKNGRVDAFSALATKYRHIKNHYTDKEGNLSIILTLQYFKFLSVITRTMSMGLIIAGEMSDRELGKIAEAYDFFGGNEKVFLENYRKCRQGQFDFCFLNVDAMEMRKNFDEVIWSREKSKLSSIENEQEEKEEKGNKIELKMTEKNKEQDD